MFSAKRRAQIKMGETIGILVVFFVLLVFGFGFFGGVQKNSAKKEVQKSFELRSVNLAQKLLFLPELQCTEEESVDIDCFDIMKLQAATDILNNKDDEFSGYEAHNMSYLSNFGKVKITFTQVYPDGETFNFYDSLSSAEYTRKLVTNIPVSFFNATSDSYGFGYVTIEVAR